MDELKIKVADNGYVVEYDDPKIAAANSKDGAKWKDPETYRVYSTQAALMQDLAELLPPSVLLPRPSMSAAAFSRAA